MMLAVLQSSVDSVDCVCYGQPHRPPFVGCNAALDFDGGTVRICGCAAAGSAGSVVE